MQFKYEIGTKVYFGTDCLHQNKAELIQMGRKAMIVTGKNSGKASGALQDVTAALQEANIEFFLYDDIGNNPDLENVKEGGNKARAFSPDFIIGIGGGSPLDAAKAIAVLAVNQMEPVELFKNTFKNKPLPIIAIPTTAGTGSEVTPYSILTRKDINTKMSFGNGDTFPKLAFMDPNYTQSLSREVTVNTAVDALSHAVEGYLSKRSTPVSDLYAMEAIKLFGACLENLKSGSFSYEIREKLLYMAMLGGMVITHTGTTIVHGMGYSLTFFKEIPHGKANGLLMKEYLKYNYPVVGEKIDNVIRKLGLNGMEEFGSAMDALLQTKVTLTEEELSLYASLAMKQKSASYNIREVSEEALMKIMKESLP